MNAIEDVRYGLNVSGQDVRGLLLSDAIGMLASAIRSEYRWPRPISRAAKAP